MDHCRSFDLSRVQFCPSRTDCGPLWASFWPRSGPPGPLAVAHAQSLWPILGAVLVSSAHFFPCPCEKSSVTSATWRSVWQCLHVRRIRSYLGRCVVTMAHRQATSGHVGPSGHVGMSSRNRKAPPRGPWDEGWSSPLPSTSQRRASNDGPHRRRGYPCCSTPRVGSVTPVLTMAYQVPIFGAWRLYRFLLCAVCCRVT